MCRNRGACCLLQVLESLLVTCIYDVKTENDHLRSERRSQSVAALRSASLPVREPNKPAGSLIPEGNVQSVKENNNNDDDEAPMHWSRLKVQTYLTLTSTWRDTHCYLSEQTFPLQWLICRGILFWIVYLLFCNVYISLQLFAHINKKGST